jgi:hypothetical protein
MPQNEIEVPLNEAPEAATLAAYEEAVKAIDWNYAEGDEAALQSYYAAKVLENGLRHQFSGAKPSDFNKEKMQAIAIIWNKYAPASESIE